MAKRMKKILKKEWRDPRVCLPTRSRLVVVFCRDSVARWFSIFNAETRTFGGIANTPFDAFSERNKKPWLHIEAWAEREIRINEDGGVI